MNDQDQINEDERQEAATETPAFLGCPAHMPKQLPSGFDGTESGEAVSRPLQKENKFGLLEHGALAMLNCIIRFNARSNRRKRANYKRRKAAAAAKQEGK